MAYFTRPEEVLQAFIELFDANKGLLGIAYVAAQEENLLPEYPAIDVSMGTTLRQDHGTQRFLVLWNMSFWVYHANFEGTHRRRSIEEMQTITNIVQFLHRRENRALNDGSEDRLIGGSGIVRQEIPGVTTPYHSSGRVMTTRLLWEGQSQVNYQDS